MGEHHDVRATHNNREEFILKWKCWQEAKGTEIPNLNVELATRSCSMMTQTKVKFPRLQQMPQALWYGNIERRNAESKKTAEEAA